MTLGTLESIWRYPVKSMRGEDVDEIFVAFSGLMGDRVYALSSTSASQDFPWHTAREQEELVLYRPRYKQRELTLTPGNMEAAMEHDVNVSATYPKASVFAIEVECPDGALYDLDAPAFIESLKDRSKGQLSLHYTQRNMVDCRPVSLFSLQTVQQLSEETGTQIDKLQFRSNLYIDWHTNGGFYEDELVGKTLKIGNTVELMIVERDPRCKLITIDPQTARVQPKLLRHVAKAHDGCAGVYAVVLNEGPVKTGDGIMLAESNLSAQPA